MNYGLNGQNIDQDYDQFLGICLSKKCKKRKAERHKARIDKKQLKNDQRRAETESLRAETQAMTTIVNPIIPPTARVAPVMSSPSPQASSSSTVQTAPKPAKAGLAGNSMMLIVGVLLVGGFLYSQSKNKTLIPTP